MLIVLVAMNTRIVDPERSLVDKIPLMHRTPPLPVLSLLLALVFAWLFHDQTAGLNVFLYEGLVLAVLWWVERPKLTIESTLALLGFALTSVLVVLHGSTLALLVNLLSAALLAGLLLAPRLHALNHSLLLGLAHALPAQRAFLQGLGRGTLGRRMPTVRGRAVFTLLAIAGIVFLFSLLYQASNPHFDRWMVKLGSELAALLDRVDLALAGTFALGLVLSNTMLLRTRNENLLQWMIGSTDELFRRRRKPANAMLGLRYELRTGVILLGVLNALLLVANVLDIRHVWFGFEFNGQYLKQFVHEGTTLLILSILLGAGIVLWFFRANQNFYRGSKALRLLAYLWLAQNVVLAISVAVRNYWYIHHYALAYKRIGVIFFLLAVVVGLLLVGLKVQGRRSRHFLFRWNALSAYCILLLLACFNWDVLIAKYNFAKQDQAFVHLDYMATLSDRALPWLIHPQHELELIDQHNQEIIGSNSFSRTLYMPPRSYADVIAERQGAFLATYPQRSWKSWTYADARAYHLLRE